MGLFRDSKCTICGQRGRCSCQRRINAEMRHNPNAGPQTCGYVFPNGTVCTRLKRGGICPNPDHPA